MEDGIDFEAQIAQDKAIKAHMDAISHKVLIMSGKGGVGKTTVTVNLARALVARGKRVGILDTDLHGPNVAKMTGCEKGSLVSNDGGKSFEPFVAPDGLRVMSLAFAVGEDQPVVWRGPMKQAAIRQFLAECDWGTLDYLIIDSPPGTGDEQLTVCQTIKSLDGTVIVTTPQDVAVLDGRRSVNFAKALKVTVLGVVENMSGLVCPHCGEMVELFGKGGGEKMASRMDVPFLGAVPLEPALREAEDAGMNMIADHPESISSKMFLSIAAKIEEKLA